MTTYSLTRDLLATGTSRKELAQLLAHGTVEHLRRGAYVERGEREVEEKHRLLVESTMALGDGRSVVSFGSAAVMHGLPVWSSAISKVHLTRIRSSGGRSGSVVHQHVAELGPEDICDIDGLPVTSLARTFVDLARTVSLGQGVAAGDRALRVGMDRAAVSEQLESAKSRKGISRARFAASLLDGLSESAGESLSRVLFLNNGIPSPELQVELYDENGAFVARPDFFWRQYGVVGEFDGKTKYEKLLRDGESAADVIMREKQREEKIKDLGLQIVRWTWDEIFEAIQLLHRIRRSLHRGRPYTGMTR